MYSILLGGAGDGAPQNFLTRNLFRDALRSVRGSIDRHSRHSAIYTDRLSYADRLSRYYKLRFLHSAAYGERQVKIYLPICIRTFDCNPKRQRGGSTYDVILADASGYKLRKFTR